MKNNSKGMPFPIVYFTYTMFHLSPIISFTTFYRSKVCCDNQPLEFLGGALGDHPAAVDHRDPVGELVGLLQVLRGEQDGDAAGDQLPDHVPEVCRLRGSSPVVGSSRNITGGRAISWPRGRAGAACRPSRSAPAGPRRGRGRTAPAAPRPAPAGAGRPRRRSRRSAPGSPRR